MRLLLQATRPPRGPGDPQGRRQGLRRLAAAAALAWTALAAQAAPPDPDRLARPVRLAEGQSSAELRGRVTGRQYIDHTLRASAGQRLTLSLRSPHQALYFNLLPPGEREAAMAIGEQSDNRFDGLLPDDGTYTVRVFLLRAAARRNESAGFTLSVGLAGAPLRPLPAHADARVAGTRYHAIAATACEPMYTRTRECEARVVRRGTDGTATVELAWDGDRRRRILFLHGEPKASDTHQPMSAVRTGQGWRVSFNAEEHFEIPDALVHGG
ncbi:hypothetical protein ACT80S_02630 [Ramlibacter sp. MAHUQ-53]|uniref:hypothetical protein n=1 Tax=unclassified Ramlibacter TaxID=2617605 RepID=UPI00363252A0